MPVSQSKRRSNDKWDSENTKIVSVKLMLKKDADLLEYWSKLGNKVEAFREAMSDYIEKHPIEE